jgi:hypothetical protein
LCTVAHVSRPGTQAAARPATGWSNIVLVCIVRNCVCAMLGRRWTPGATV